MDVVEALEAMVSGYIDRVTGLVSTEIDSDGYAGYYVIREAIAEIERLRGNFKEKIVELMNAYEKATGEEPTRIHVPRNIETDILRLTYDDVGPLVNTINSEGSRNAFEKIFGMEVVWDADQFKVERVRNDREDDAGDKAEGADENEE